MRGPACGSGAAEVEGLHRDRLRLVAARALVAHDLTADQLDHAALHLVDDARVVGGHQHGGAVGVDRRQQRHDAGAGRRVEVSGRLVGQQDGRLVDDRRARSRRAAARHRRARAGSAPACRRGPTILSTSGTASWMKPLLLPITCSVKATLSNTVFCGSSRKSWKTTPRLRRKYGTLRLGRRVELLPEHVDLALGGRSSLSTRRRKLDLPGAGRADQEDELPLEHLEARRR